MYALRAGTVRAMQDRAQVVRWPHQTLVLHKLPGAHGTQAN